jgi:UDPglucose 6-dehydrogenase
MHVVVVGAGYVGLVTGACLADAGLRVVCVDADEAKVTLLQNGGLPIFEPGLAEVVLHARIRGKLSFTTNIGEALPGADVVFVCVGTPSKNDGSVDLTAVLEVATEIGRHLDHRVVIVAKSTVPVGTCQQIRIVVASELMARGKSIDFEVASNPEFLKEGTAVSDFQRPDRIVVGVDSVAAREVLEQVYRSFVLNGHPVHFMDVASSELTKYAANAMLAMRISFMNLISQVCESVGADVSHVRAGIASDPRIGSKFLYAGIGYGGSCFSKDLRAITETGKELGIDMSLLSAVEHINERQKISLVDRAEAELGTLRGRRITVWGLAFKPNTDDVRCAPAIEIIRALTKRGAEVIAYDPVAIDPARRELGETCTFSLDPYEALDGADALILATEWNEFRNVDGAQMARRMRGQLVFDGRNALGAEQVEPYGLKYRSVGRKS